MSFLEIKQSLKLAQQLVMTPQLQQAIKLLQLSRLELVDSIQQEIEQNPMLEEEVLDTSPPSSADQPTPDQPEPEPIVAEKTSEVNLDENPSTIGEIDWADYANEYESGGSFKPRESMGEEQPSRFDIITEKPDLLSHLRWQLSLSDIEDPAEMEVGLFVLGNLDGDGFLKVTIDEIITECGCSRDIAEGVIDLIQQMDPAGVCASNVQESLLLQLKRLNMSNSLPARIIQNHLHFLETKNYKAIAKATRQSMEDVINAIKVIIGLDPHPGQAYSNETPHYILPDVYIQKVDGEYVILLNDEGLPRLKISGYYKEVLKNKTKGNDETKTYIQDKLKSAAWLIKSIQQRQRTIYRVVESLLKFQYDFFEKGVDHLKPLVLRDVAEDIEMHESTISRVTTNKYVHTPQGTFELKYFFTSSIEGKGGDALSSESIKARIRKIVQGENPDKPLSDKAISEIFQKDGIKLARRTVAKYREQLGILSSKFRKQPKI